MYKIQNKFMRQILRKIVVIHVTNKKELKSNEKFKERIQSNFEKIKLVINVSLLNLNNIIYILYLKFQY